MWLRGFALLALLTGCDLGVALPGNPDPSRDAERLAPASSAPIIKAPSAREALRSCPLAEPDFAGLRAKLAEGDFESLDATYEALLAAYAQSPVCESYLWMATRNLADEDFALLDRWVAARPESWGAFTARGARWVDTGYARRGTSAARNVTDAQWAGMREAFLNGDRDLRRALELEPKGFVAYGYAIYRMKSDGDPEAITASLEAFVAHDPRNVGVRKRAIEALGPRWGGSLDTMRALAEDAQRFAAESPRLRMLPGLAIAEVAKGAHDQKRYAEAVEIYGRALAYGDERDWYDSQCDNLEHLSDWPALAQTATHWIDAAGEDAQARFYLGKALLQAGRASASLEHFDRAHALWPKNAEYLRWRGHARGQSGRAGEAVDDLRRSLELQPGDTWAIQQLGELQAAQAAGAPVAGAATAGRARPRPGDATLPAASHLGLARPNS